MYSCDHDLKDTSYYTPHYSLQFYSLTPLSLSLLFDEFNIIPSKSIITLTVSYLPDLLIHQIIT